MTLCMIVSALFLVQSTPAATSGQAYEEREAAYEELTAGENERAIAQIEAALERTPGDPALLINLGTAYAREGRVDDARGAFQSASTSKDRYRVQLADGSWEDSRKVARMALDSLDVSLASK